MGILGELARYPEALVFMRDQMRKNNSAALRQLYNHILLEADRQKGSVIRMSCTALCTTMEKITKKHWITC